MQIIPTLRRSSLCSLISRHAIDGYGVYPDLKQRKIIDKHQENIESFNLKEGTFLIADTSHLHRGGYSFKENEVILLCIL